MGDIVIPKKIRAGLFFIATGIFFILSQAYFNHIEPKNLSDYPSKNIIKTYSYIDEFEDRRPRRLKNIYYEFFIITSDNERYYVRSKEKISLESIRRKVLRDKNLIVYFSHEYGKNGGFEIRSIQTKNKIAYSFDQYLESRSEKSKVTKIIGFISVLVGIVIVGLHFEN